MPVEIDLEHLHPDAVARIDHLARILDELLAQLRNVDQTILVNPNIDEGAKVGDVGDNAGTDHSRHQVSDGVQVVPEGEGGKGLTRVATRLLQFTDDIIEGELTDLIPQMLRLAHKRHAASEKVTDPLAHLLGQLLEQRVALGVNPGVVEGMARLGYPQEASRQFEGLAAEPGNFEKLLPRPEEPLL